MLRASRDFGLPHTFGSLCAFRVDFAAPTGVKSTQNPFDHRHDTPRVDFAVSTGVKSTQNPFDHWRLGFWVDFAAYTGVKSTRNPVHNPSGGDPLA